MANNRLYIADPKSKKAIMIAKSMGRGWYTWYKDSPEEIHEKLKALFDENEELADVGSDTSFVIITEYDESFEQYEVIEHDETD